MHLSHFSSESSPARGFATIRLLLVFLGALLAQGTIAQVTLIQNNSTTLDLAMETIYETDVPIGQASLSIAAHPGDFDIGDCDIYVSYGSFPTPEMYDFKSATLGNNESIIISNPAAGNWYTLLHAREFYLAVNLTVLYNVGTQNNLVSPTNSIQTLPGLMISRVRGSLLKVAWPVSAGGAVLEVASQISAPMDWTPLSLPLTADSATNSAYVSVTDDGRIYRLRSP